MSVCMCESVHVCECVYKDKDHDDMNERPFLCRIWETVQHAH